LREDTQGLSFCVLWHNGDIVTLMSEPFGYGFEDGKVFLHRVGRELLCP
jgi:hypothetical protein